MISLIVPVYNGERFLRACADSVLNQSMREIEVIFVDDGSTDGSREILKEYAQKDVRVRVIAQENRGVSAARNRGIEEAKGEYLWFFDCDDVMHEGGHDSEKPTAIPAVPHRGGRGLLPLRAGVLRARRCDESARV